MILLEKGNVNVTPKLLTGYEDTIQFISHICSLYFDIESECVNRILNSNYLDVIERFVSQIDSRSPLILCFNGELSNNFIDESDRVYNIVVSDRPEDILSSYGDYLGFYKSPRKLKITEDSGTYFQKTGDKTFSEFILLPVFFNNNFPSKQMVPSYLSDLLVPIYNHNLELGKGTGSHSLKYEQISKKFKEILDIIEQIDDDLSIDDVNIKLCDSLKLMIDPKTGNLENYQVKIEDEFVIEDIKSRVREWSVEISRIIREYLSKFSGEYEDDEVISLSETSSEYDSEITSGSSSPEGSVFSISFLSLKTEKVKKLDTNMVKGISECIEIICSDIINSIEEKRFWSSYQKVLANLIQKVESTNFVNTLLLLEYNEISVENIYSFEESIKLLKQIIREVDEINSFMTALSLDDLLSFNQLSNFCLIIDKIFNNIRRCIHTKYLKSERFVLLFKGIVAQIINSVSRIMSDELKESEIEGNYKVLIKTVQVMFEFKSKILNMDKFFKKNKIEMTASDNSFIVILDLYIDILQSFCRFNNKFIKLVDDINCIVNHLSDDVDLDENLEEIEVNEISKFTLFYNEFTGIRHDVDKSYVNYILDLKSHYSNLSENIVNIVELDEINMRIKSELGVYETNFQSLIKRYLDVLDLFEALPVVNIINSFKIQCSHDLFINKIDCYVDEIIEEYEIIVTMVDRSDGDLYYYDISENSKELFSKMIIKEKIMVIVI